MNTQDYAAALGAKVAEQLSNERITRCGPSALASGMIAALMLKQPDAKLPEIIANTDVKAWMVECLVTENMLRAALTEARRALRVHAEEAVVKKPRPRRVPTRTAVSPEPDTAPSKATHHWAPAPLFDDGMVPNKPLPRAD